MNPQLPPSVLTKSQEKVFGPVIYTEQGQEYRITAKVRYDDHCGNGHNTFSITGEIERARGGRWSDDAGGCVHKEIAEHFPKLAPLLKWHLTSTDGPMHYIENTVYQAGERDHWGLLKGEFKQHTSRGPIQANGVPGVPHWELALPEPSACSVYAYEKPAPVTLEWKPSGTTGEGKGRALNLARSSAVWPDATDAELCAPADELRAKLTARLPALMVEFKAAVESLGFVY